jgi:hypothetical protein
MAAVEKMLHTEMFVEARIARLESDTEHIKKDLTRIEGKVDKLDEKLADLDRKIDRKIDEVSKALHAFQLEVTNKFGELAKNRWVDRVWWLIISAATLSVMARAFQWI